MANPVSAAYQPQQAEPINQTTQANTTAKPVGNRPAPPQDTVTISPEAQAASQAQQTQQAAANANNGGQ